MSWVAVLVAVLPLIGIAVDPPPMTAETLSVSAIAICGDVEDDHLTRISRRPLRPSQPWSRPSPSSELARFHTPAMPRLMSGDALPRFSPRSPPHAQ
jgi:hypothetical protein